MIRSSFAARLRPVLAATATLLLAVLLLAAPPAAAHDVLVEADPADGDVLDEAPAQVTLTFNNDPLDMGSALSLRDASGEVVAEVAGSASGRDVVFELDDAATEGGELEASWRVVSSDGHPIDGELSFTVDAGPEPTEAPSEENSAEALGAPEATADTPAPAEDSEADAPASGLNALPMWLKVLIAIAALGSVVTLIIITVRRMRRDSL